MDERVNSAVKTVGAIGRRFLRHCLRAHISQIYIFFNEKYRDNQVNTPVYIALLRKTSKFRCLFADC